MVLELFGEAAAAGGDRVEEEVGHRHELEVRARHGQRVGGRTASPPTAADQGDPDLVAAGRMNSGRGAGEGGERRGRGDPAGRAEESAA